MASFTLHRLKSVRAGNDNGDENGDDADWNLCKDIQTEADYWRRQRTALVASIASIAKDKCLSSDKHEDLKTKATVKLNKYTCSSIKFTICQFSKYIYTCHFRINTNKTKRGNVQTTGQDLDKIK